MADDFDTIRFLAYSAITQAANDREAAIASLNQMVLSQFSISAGKVMTQASATNKSFTYTVDPSYSPFRIAKLAHQAICLLNGLSDEQLPTLTRTPSQWALAKF